MHCVFAAFFPGVFLKTHLDAIYFRLHVADRGKRKESSNTHTCQNINSSHTNMQTNRQADTHIWICTHAHTLTQTCIHNSHTNRQIDRQAHIHTQAHSVNLYLKRIKGINGQANKQTDRAVVGQEMRLIYVCWNVKKKCLACDFSGAW